MRPQPLLPAAGPGTWAEVQGLRRRVSQGSGKDASCRGDLGAGAEQGTRRVQTRHPAGGAGSPGQRCPQKSRVGQVCRSGEPQAPPSVMGAHPCPLQASVSTCTQAPALHGAGFPGSPPSVPYFLPRRSHLGPGAPGSSSGGQTASHGHPSLWLEGSHHRVVPETSCGGQGGAAQQLLRLGGRGRLAWKNRTGQDRGPEAQWCR